MGRTHHRGHRENPLRPEMTGKMDRRGSTQSVIVMMGKDGGEGKGEGEGEGESEGEGEGGGKHTTSSPPFCKILLTTCVCPW